MHSQDSYDDSNIDDEARDLHNMGWPFLIKGIMESPACARVMPDTMSALLWTISAVFGIVYALLVRVYTCFSKVYFTGYRCLRAVGFLSGLLVGANCVFILQDFEITLLGSPADSALAIIAGLLGAVLGSAHPIASALVSAFAGALLAAVAMAICVATMPENEFGPREIYVAVVGGAVIFSVLTLCCVKYITILATSIVGTAMIIASVDFFVNGLETVNWILNMKPNPAPPPCYGGILICAWPVSIIISLMVQCFITGWRVNHRKRAYYRHNHMVQCNAPRPPTRPRETREEARQRKFRYLYQVRTARGDIISQNFVSALQKRIHLGGTETPSERSIKTSSNERNTFRSDRTHFTTIPPDSELFDKIEIGRDVG